MFAGYTVSDMRIRQQDLLRDGGYEPMQRQIGGEWVIDHRLRRLFIQVIVSLLAFWGL